MLNRVVLGEITLVLIVLFLFSDKGVGYSACVVNKSSVMNYTYMAGNVSNIIGPNMTLLKKENINVTSLSSPTSGSFDQFDITNHEDNNTSKFVVKDNITQIKQGTRLGFDDSNESQNIDDPSP